MESKSNNQKFQRNGGITHTVLIRPLSPDTTVEEVEDFVKRAALNKPLRVELIHPQKRAKKKQNNPDAKQADPNQPYFGSFAYVTFPTTQDCDLVVQNLGNGKVRERVVRISYSAVPRMDLKGKTCMLELSCDANAFKTKEAVLEFLQNGPLIISGRKIFPYDIRKAVGNAELKNKWILHYSTPEQALLGFSCYSGRMFQKKFVTLGFQLHPSDIPFDRQECFANLTNRMALQGVHRRTTEEQIKAFVKANGLKLSDLEDIEFIHQTKLSLAQFANNNNNNNNNKKWKQKKEQQPKSFGFVALTWKTFDLARQAFEQLNEKVIPEVECHVQTQYRSPSFPEVLKEELKDTTRVIHIANLPWFTSIPLVKDWFATNGVAGLEVRPFPRQNKSDPADAKKPDESMDVDGNDDTVDSFLTDLQNALKDKEHNNNNDDDKEQKKQERNKRLAESLYPVPITVFLKHRMGYPNGRAHATFATPQDATKAILNMHGKTIAGRKIQLNWAVELEGHKKRLAQREAAKANTEDEKTQQIKQEDEQTKPKKMEVDTENDNGTAKTKPNKKAAGKNVAKGKSPQKRKRAAAGNATQPKANKRVRVE